MEQKIKSFILGKDICLYAECKDCKRKFGIQVLEDEEKYGKDCISKLVFHKNHKQNN